MRIDEFNFRVQEDNGRLLLELHCCGSNLHNIEYIVIGEYVKFDSDKGCYYIDLPESKVQEFISEISNALKLLLQSGVDSHERN